MAEEVMTEVDNLESLSDDDLTNRLDSADDDIADDVDDGIEDESLPEEDTETQTVTLEDLQSQLEESNKRYQNLQSLNGRQSQELGELRKFQKEYLEKQNNSAEDNQMGDDEFIDNLVKNPQKQISQVLQKEIERRESLKMQQETEQAEVYKTHSEYVSQQVPELQSLRPTILEVAKELGTENPQDYMIDQSIVQNPDLVVAYAKIAQLKTELDNASKKGPEMLKKVAAASKRGGTISAKSGKASTSAQNTFSGDPTQLSDDALRKALSELQSQE